MDLGSLGTLPRERDRSAVLALATAAAAEGGGRGALGAGLSNGSYESPAPRASLMSQSSYTSPVGREAGERKLSDGAIGGPKEVWQGGRWRRGGTAELMEGELEVSHSTFCP